MSDTSDILKYTGPAVRLRKAGEVYDSVMSGLAEDNYANHTYPKHIRQPKTGETLKLPWSLNVTRNYEYPAKAGQKDLTVPQRAELADLSGGGEYAAVDVYNKNGWVYDEKLGNYAPGKPKPKKQQPAEWLTRYMVEEGMIAPPGINGSDVTGMAKQFLKQNRMAETAPIDGVYTVKGLEEADKQRQAELMDLQAGSNMVRLGLGGSVI